MRTKVLNPPPSGLTPKYLLLMALEMEMEWESGIGRVALGVEIVNKTGKLRVRQVW